MKTSDFSFDLPPELIAQYPAEQRDSSRLLHLNRSTGEANDYQFTNLVDLLRPNDLLVFNNTRVIPARLLGNKSTGGKVEILIERLLSDKTALAQIRASKTPKPGTSISLSEQHDVQVIDRQNSFFIIESDSEIKHILNDCGHMPLPPYIDRQDQVFDHERYQTVYAKQEGAVAAPTAGLHFTKSLIEKLGQNQIQSAFLTLHVGAGTFQPVRVDNIEQHTMHSECYEINQSTCDQINTAKKNGSRVIAVGTTTVRVLETLGKQGELQAGRGETQIFIYPGFKFNVIDGLITNFHLPESTLLMLVSAFAGKENILSAYQHAIQQRYRFFSYGDAMFIN